MSLTFHILKVVYVDNHGIGAQLMGIFTNFSLSQQWRPSTLSRWWSSNPKPNNDRLSSMHNHPSCPWLIPYPLRECSGTAHQVESSPSTGSLRESREVRPCSHIQYYTPNKQRPSRSKDNSITMHVSPDPMESGRPRTMTRRHKMLFSHLFSGMNSTFQHRNSLLRFFWEFILIKASEPLWPTPNRCQFWSTSLLLQVFHPSDRLTAVHRFSSNISSWLAVQLLIWRCKLRSFPWKWKFRTSTVTFTPVCCSFRN